MLKFKSIELQQDLTRWGCGRQLGHQGGSSCIPTQTDFAPLSFTSGLASDLTRPFASWVSHKQCAQGLVPRVLAASPPAFQPVARAPKYSESQKQAALEHYISHDRCISVTIKAVDYPGRGTLTAWVREALPDTRASMVGRSWHLGYAEEVRQAGVIGLCSGDESAQQVVDRLGVSRPTLYSWKDQLLCHEAPSLMKRRKANSKVPEREELERRLEALQRDVRGLQLEHDPSEEGQRTPKKDLGVDLQILSNWEKTQLIDALKEVYRLPELLAQLRIARSSYFYHRARMCLADKYAAVRHSLAEIFEANRRCYGYRRLQTSLVRQSVIISEKVVQRLMKQEQLVVARPRRRRFGSYLRGISPAPENLFNRDFHADAPNVRWLTNITEFQIPAGKVYLSPIIDCVDGMAISWSIATQPDTGLVNTMLDAAIGTVTDGEEQPIIHSDRGAHYRWPAG